MVDEPPGSSAVNGCALDHVAPLPRISVRLYGEVPVSLTVDDKVGLTLPRGHYNFVLAVSNATAAGNPR